MYSSDTKSQHKYILLPLSPLRNSLLITKSREKLLAHFRRTTNISCWGVMDWGEHSRESWVGPLVLNMEKHLNLFELPSTALHIKVKDAETSKAIRTNTRSPLVKTTFSSFTLHLKILLLTFSTVSIITLLYCTNSERSVPNKADGCQGRTQTVIFIKPKQDYLWSITSLNCKQSFTFTGHIIHTM